MRATYTSSIGRALSLTCLIALLCGPGAAAAVTFVRNGVEFTDPVVVDVAAGSDLILETTEDIYVFAPNGFITEMALLVAAETLFIEDIEDTEPFDSSVVPACAPGCPSQILEFTSDVVVQILAPLGEVELRAGGSMILTPLAIPEPGTAALMGAGLFALGQRTNRSRADWNPGL